MKWLDLSEHRPRVHDRAWVAHNATLVGDVSLAAGASVWFTAVVRADGASIDIGQDSNIQDGCVLHADPGIPIRIGRGVSVGHRAVLHGCDIEDNVLVGMGAVVMNGTRIGRGCVIAAGAVVLQDTEVPVGSLVAGVPGKVRRPLTPDEQRGIEGNAAAYLALVQAYRRTGAVPIPARPYPIRAGASDEETLAGHPPPSRPHDAERT